MKKLTIDSSDIIAPLLENEPRHEETLRIWEPIIAGRDVAIMSYFVKLTQGNDHAIMCLKSLAYEARFGYVTMYSIGGCSQSDGRALSQSKKLYYADPHKIP